ncbi:ribonuclease HII [Patescibacteria group bacterium]|nr:ribonuclease HII [Patescibacteria group bacterium]
MKNSPKWLIGVDEAGRGPLAGPVSVGLVLVPANFDWKLIPGVGDSKQLSEKKREEIFKRAQVLQKEGKLRYVVEMVAADKIDSDGISVCIKKSIAKGLNALTTTRSYLVLQNTLENKQTHKIKSTRQDLLLEPYEVMVKLDGSLKAPAEYVHQETIIKGDSKEKVIGLASIMAKVTRDRYMIQVAAKPEFVAYDFARHKGYGTRAHREAIALHGLSTQHRVSYCGNITIVV